MFIEIVAPESWEEKQRGDEFARQSPTEGSLLPPGDSRRSSAWPCSQGDYKLPRERHRMIFLIAPDDP